MHDSSSKQVKRVKQLPFYFSLQFLSYRERKKCITTRLMTKLLFLKIHIITLILIDNLSNQWNSLFKSQNCINVYSFDYEWLFYRWDDKIVYKFLHNFAVSHLEIKYVAWSIDRFRVWSIATRLMVSHLHDTLWYDLIESIDTKRNSVYIYIIDVFDVIPHFHLRNEARQWIMQTESFYFTR